MANICQEPWKLTLYKAHLYHLELCIKVVGWNKDMMHEGYHVILLKVSKLVYNFLNTLGHHLVQKETFCIVAVRICYKVHLLSFFHLTNFWLNNPLGNGEQFYVFLLYVKAFIISMEAINVDVGQFTQFAFRLVYRCIVYVCLARKSFHLWFCAV